MLIIYVYIFISIQKRTSQFWFIVTGLHNLGWKTFMRKCAIHSPFSKISRVIEPFIRNLNFYVYFCIYKQTSKTCKTFLWNLFSLHDEHYENIFLFVVKQNSYKFSFWWERHVKWCPDAIINIIKPIFVRENLVCSKKLFAFRNADWCQIQKPVK